MPKIALADTLLEWEKLLMAATETGPHVPGLPERLAELRAALERARELEALRARLQAERQQATDDLVTTRRQGDDLASAIRNKVMAHFGPRWEGLVQFGVRPLRGRRRSATSRKASTPSHDETEPSAQSDR
jgi:hypothetical protein